jgi:hypothetical protein
MGKLKDFFGKHKTKTCLVLFSALVLGGLTYKSLKTNVYYTPNEFIVCNYDIGRGYKFVYSANESGRESFVEDRGEYVLFAETNEEDINKIDSCIRFERLGKDHPLNDKYISLEHCTDWGREFNVGENMLKNIREQYKTQIPYEKVRAKIKY